LDDGQRKTPTLAVPALGVGMPVLLTG